MVENESTPLILAPPCQESAAKPEWGSFFDSLMAQFTPPEKVYTLICNNHLDNFRTKTVTVKLENNTFKGSFQYVVIHCDADASMTFDLPDPFASISEIFAAVYHMLWTTTLCSECYDIVTVPNNLCNQCYPMRVMHHYGIAHNLTLSIPTCPICFEQVFYTKLHCGHYVHKTCFIKMNNDRWYTYEMELKCPICRALINSQDRYDFFLWYG